MVLFGKPTESGIEWTHHGYTIELEPTGKFLVLGLRRYESLKEAVDAINEEIKAATPHGSMALSVLGANLKEYTIKGAHRGHGQFLTQGDQLTGDTGSLVPNTEWVKTLLIRVKEADERLRFLRGLLSPLILGTKYGNHRRYSGEMGNHNLKEDYARLLGEAKELESRLGDNY